VSVLRTARARLSAVRARRRLSPTAPRVTRERLTYLSAQKLANLEWCAREVRPHEVPCDVFETIPPPSQRDGADYDGCRIATDEFLAAHDDLVGVRDAGNLVLQRR
jgi:hypothetical protein